MQGKRREASKKIQKQEDDLKEIRGLFRHELLSKTTPSGYKVHSLRAYSTKEVMYVYMNVGGGYTIRIGKGCFVEGWIDYRIT